MLELKSEALQQIALVLPILLFSLSVHEYAHALVATRLGDPTPRRQGRLTLSPLSHIDLMGSIVFPCILLLGSSGSFFFGWAKPVQFNPANFTRKVSIRQGSALAAGAGPLSNVILAILSLVIIRIATLTFDISFVKELENGEQAEALIIQILVSMFGLNVLLAVFNLLPLPPLDGSYFFPPSMDYVRDFLSRYSFLLFMLLFIIPLPILGASVGQHFIIDPLTTLLSQILKYVAFFGV